jgi:hypothetical protein
MIEHDFLHTQGIYCGDPWDVYVVVLNEDGTAYDVTESGEDAWVCQLRARPDSTLDVIADVEVAFATVAVFDRENLDETNPINAELLAALDELEETDPVLHLHLDSDTTQALRPSLPWYDIEEVGVTTWQRGRVEIRGDVSVVETEE